MRPIEKLRQALLTSISLEDAREALLRQANEDPSLSDLNTLTQRMQVIVDLRTAFLSQVESLRKEHLL